MNKKEKLKRSEKKSPTFIEWLIHGKGSVSEPWPEVEEVLKDPDVQNEIKEVEDAFAQSKEKKLKK